MIDNDRPTSILDVASNHAFACGGAILTFGAAIVIATASLFWFHVPSTASYFYAGLLAACIFILFAWRGADRRVPHSIMSVALFTATLFGCLEGSSRFYDISWDGQAYHQEAILQLAGGLVPTEQNASGEHALWIDHYPKASWYVSSAILLASGDIEAGKAYQILLILASGLLAYRAARTLRGLTEGRAALLAGLAALNPVSVSQSLSFYVDGQVGSLMLCQLATGWMACRSTRQRWCWVFLHAASVVLLVNLKFTAVVYAAILATAVGLVCQRHGTGWRAHAASSVAALILGVFFIGYAPYYRNTVEKGHIFFPLMGEKPVDVLTHNEPESFAGRNRFANAFVALFSRSAKLDSGSRSEPQLKFPLTISYDELGTFGFDPDIRIGGFGPWFSGILVLSHVLLVTLWLTRSLSWRTLALYAFLLLSVCVNPAMWWARYVPQLWFIPLLVLAEALRRERRPGLDVLNVALVLCLLVNVGLVSTLYLRGQVRATRDIDLQLAALRRANDVVSIDFGAFRPLRARLQKHGIRFLERDDRPPGAIELRHSHREAFFTTVSRDARPTGRRGWG